MGRVFGFMHSFSLAHIANKMYHPKSWFHEAQFRIDFLNGDSWEIVGHCATAIWAGLIKAEEDEEFLGR